MAVKMRLISALLLAVVLVGCGSEDSSSGNGTSFAQEDIQFACGNEQCQSGSEYCLLTGTFNGAPGNATQECVKKPANFNGCATAQADARAHFTTINCSQAIACQLRNSVVTVTCSFSM